MDLRAYYGKIRELERGMAEAAVVIVSLETADGGKPGVRTEAPRRVAARMLMEGRARLASPEEAQEFRHKALDAKRAADQAAAASRLQVTVVSACEPKRE